MQESYPPPRINSKSSFDKLRKRKRFKKIRFDKIRFFQGRWLRRLAIIILLISILHNPVPTFAQAENQDSSATISNQATYTYADTDSSNTNTYTGTSNQVDVSFTPLIDPFGRITSCGGRPLANYEGISVALYNPDPNDPTGTELGSLVSLTPTELPDIPGNGIPKGINPNTTNVNPYFLTNESGGAYSFLFDPNKAQITVGRSYILVIDPPPNPFVGQRRVKFEIVSVIQTDGRPVVQYLATSLDGLPISPTGSTQFARDVVFIEDAEKQGLEFAAFQISLAQCQIRQINIVKTADRATAEPGDIVTYRLRISNLAEEDLKNSTATDTLPTGLQFLPDSVRGEIDGQPLDITTQVNGQKVKFISPISIPPEKVLNVVYAARITPDAARGSGINSVIVTSERDDNNLVVTDGPSTHKLQIRRGITSNCGTIVGRVFVDKNFDGEQQPGEPGVPNAVILMNDGNRVITDANGLYSIANVLPGYHTGVLDLYSLPGYTLAPNLYFKERNSQSRLVRLQPGGMARMNFAVTPTFAEEAQQKEGK